MKKLIITTAIVLSLSGLCFAQTTQQQLDKAKTVQTYLAGQIQQTVIQYNMLKKQKDKVDKQIRELEKKLKKEVTK